MPTTSRTSRRRLSQATAHTPPVANGTPPEWPQTAPEGCDSARPGHGSKTGATRERAIVAILAESTIGAAAKRAGIGERTLRRWLTEDEAFQGALAEARCLAFEAGMGRVQALTARAVEALDELLGAKKCPSVRLGAARTVAELAIHQHDADTIMRKLDVIESYQRQRNLNGGR